MRIIDVLTNAASMKADELKIGTVVHLSHLMVFGVVINPFVWRAEVGFGFSEQEIENVMKSEKHILLSEIGSRSCFRNESLPGFPNFNWGTIQDTRCFYAELTDNIHIVRDPQMLYSQLTLLEHLDYLKDSYLLTVRRDLVLLTLALSGNLPKSYRCADGYFDNLGKFLIGALEP